VALATGLIMTWIVILFLSADEARFAPEQPVLLKAIATFTALAAVCGGSLYGELRERRWRFTAHAASVAMLAVAVWLYWPK
jgi:hypothetical protein